VEQPESSPLSDPGLMAGSTATNAGKPTSSHADWIIEPRTPHSAKWLVEKPIRVASAVPHAGFAPTHAARVESGVVARETMIGQEDGSSLLFTLNSLVTTCSRRFVRSLPRWIGYRGQRNQEFRVGGHATTFPGSFNLNKSQKGGARKTSRGPPSLIEMGNPGEIQETKTQQH
jgi:hypothetical protein